MPPNRAAVFSPLKWLCMSICNAMRGVPVPAVQERGHSELSGWQEGHQYVVRRFALGADLAGPDRGAAAQAGLALPAVDPHRPLPLSGGRGPAVVDAVLQQLACARRNSRPGSRTALTGPSG